MEMNFEFTDVSADRAPDHRPPAAEDVSAADTDRQADTGQHLQAATDAATLDGARDHEALASRGPSRRESSAEPAVDGTRGHAAQDAMRPAVRVRYVDEADVVENPGPAYPAKPAESPDAVGFYTSRHPDHVRVFYLEPDDGDDSADQRHQSAADKAHGDQQGQRYEVSHDGSDTTARRFTTGSNGETTEETVPGHRDTGSQQTEGEGVTERAAESDEADGDDDKNAFAKGLSGVLRVTGRVISDASRGALEAYRQGPGERILEDQLERRAEKVGKQAVKREVRAAKRGAPFFQRQYAANQIRYHAGAQIKRSAKQEYKDAVRASWREGDDAAAQGPQKQDDEA